MVNPDNSGRIIIHEGLAHDQCIKAAGLDNTLNMRPSPLPSGVVSPDMSSRTRSASGTTTPREVWVDSKERLSEMATNIRGISTALSKVSIALQVKSILIVTKLSDDTLPAKASQLATWLLKTPFAESEGLTVAVQDVFKAQPGFDYQAVLTAAPRAKDQLHFWSEATIAQEPEKYDMAVTLGGDGTVLFMSWLFQQVVPPVLSFGLGSLSFMTEHKFEDYKATLDHILDDGITAALRMRFTCTIMRTKNPDLTGENDLRDEIAQSGELNGDFSSTHTEGETYVILNDVVVDRGPNPVMTMTELFGNYEFLTMVSADGVVISTPSGSTAYSMSAGGSLAHPDVPATLVTPICPHSLSFRPLLLPDSMIIKVGVPYDARAPAFASFDGKKRVELRRGDFLHITASRYPFPKIIPPTFTSGTWVQQLGQGLHWNEQRRPKRFTY